MLSAPRSIRPTREETRCRILEAADALFRQYGFGKTTIADIAQELGMSPANIYKFFSSKDDLVEASANRNLAIIRRDVSAVARSKKRAKKRLEDLVLVIFQFHRDLFRNERQIFKMVAQAEEEAWPCIDDYYAFLFTTIKTVLEEGIAADQIASPRDLDQTATALLDALFLALHPHLRHSWSPAENQDRVIAHVRFVINALR